MNLFFRSLVLFVVLTQSLAATPVSLTGNLDDWSREYLPEGVSVYATDWLRWSEWRYFDPPVPGGDPDYGYFSNRLRFGAKVNRPDWQSEISLQYVNQAYLPDDASGTPGGGLGLGAAYYGLSQTSSPDSIYIKYLNLGLLNISGSGVNINAGRFDYSSGTEVKTGIAKLDWLKNTRIDARLIGGFGWSIYQRSFDGIKIDWKNNYGQLNVAAFHPTQGGFSASANNDIDEIDVVATAYTIKPGVIAENMEIQIFDYYLSDNRSIPTRPDNTGITTQTRQDIAIHSVGGHLVSAKQIGMGTADFLLWGTYQFGDWFEQKHRAGGVAAEAGYQFDNLPWKPWFRTGAFYGSGDDNPADNTHGTFYQMLPTVRKYAFTTTYNLMNNEDYFVQLLLSPLKQLKLRTDIHYLRLAESSDLWYGGAGATVASGVVQGYAGRPSGGASELGTSLEFTLQYQVSNDINIEAFYGHVFGSDVVKQIFTDSSDFDFFFVESTVVF